MTHRKMPGVGSTTGHNQKLTNAPDFTPQPYKGEEYLNLLDSSEERFTFQTFGEGKSKGNPKLNRTLHGTLREHASLLAQLNKAGAGVFVTVNATDFQGRSKGNIVRARVIFADMDDFSRTDFLEEVRDFMPPHFVVSSSPGKWHVYWRVNDLPLDQFSPMQKRLALRLGTDPSVSDLSRVMRLPGFFHVKSEPFLVDVFRGEDLL